jgi:hypothetical protein
MPRTESASRPPGRPGPRRRCAPGAHAPGEPVPGPRSPASSLASGRASAFGNVRPSSLRARCHRGDRQGVAEVLAAGARAHDHGLGRPSRPDVPSPRFGRDPGPRGEGRAPAGPPGSEARRVAQGAIRVPVPGLGRDDGRGRRPAAQSRSGPPSRDRTAAAMARPPAGAAGAVARGASSASHSAPARVDHPSRGRPPDEAEGLRGDDEGPGDAGALGRRAPVGGGRRRGNMRLARLRGDVRPVGQMVLDVVRSCQR